MRLRRLSRVRSEGEREEETTTLTWTWSADRTQDWKINRTVELAAGCSMNGEEVRMERISNGECFLPV